MSACRRYREWLIDSLDGTLAPEAADRLRAHLERCPACAKALEDLRRTRDLVRSLPTVEPPPWLEDRILVRAHTGQAPRRAARPWWRTSSLPAAALVMLCLTGYLVFRNPGPTTPSPAGRASPTFPGAPAPAAEARGSAVPAPKATAPAPRPPAPAAPQGNLAGSAPAVAPQAPPPAPRAAAKAEAAPAGPPAAAADQAQARTGRALMESAAPAPMAKAAAPASLALSWDPNDTIRAASQAQAAFAAAGATILARPGPDYRGITARVPGPALDALLERLEALGPLQDAPPRPTRLRGEVLVTMTW